MENSTNMENKYDFNHMRGVNNFDPRCGVLYVLDFSREHVAGVLHPGQRHVHPQDLVGPLDTNGRLAVLTLFTAKNTHN